MQLISWNNSLYTTSCLICGEFQLAKPSAAAAAIVNVFCAIRQRKRKCAFAIDRFQTLCDFSTLKNEIHADWRLKRFIANLRLGGYFITKFLNFSIKIHHFPSIGITPRTPIITVSPKIGKIGQKFPQFTKISQVLQDGNLKIILYALLTFLFFQKFIAS